MATKNIVPRADGEGQIGTLLKKWLKGLFKNIHVEQNITDETNSVTVAQLKTASDNQHTHANKALLDTYSQTEADLGDAVSKKHTHSNKTVLDDIEAALTNVLKADYDDAVTKEHTHTNKALLDTYNQTEASLSDAVQKKHAHGNLSILDNTQESFTTALKTQLDGLPAALDSKVNTAEINYVTYLKLVSELKMYLRAQGFQSQDDLLIPHQALNCNYMAIDKYGVPHWVVEIPRKNWDPSSVFASANIHPAFIVNGVQRRIFIGKFQLSEVNIDGTNRLVTWANQAVKHTINFDNMDSAISSLNDDNNITGFHMITNAEWSLIALLCKARNQMPYGNNNYGRDVDDKSITGVLEAGSEANFGSTSPARWLTGSGNNLTSHDRSEAGIFDLNGNILEWVRGLRINNGEINILDNNDAADYTKSHAVGSEEWRALLVDASLVSPGTTNTLKYDGTATIAVVEAITTAGAPSTAFESVTTSLNGLGIDSLKKLSLLPYTSGLNSDRLYINNDAERLPLRGGYWYNGTNAGVFYLYLTSGRPIAYSYLGSRLAFVL